MGSVLIVLFHVICSTGQDPQPDIKTMPVDSAIGFYIENAGLLDSALTVALVDRLDETSGYAAFQITLFGIQRGFLGNPVAAWERCIGHIRSSSPLDTINLARALNYCGSTYHAKGNIPHPL